MERRGVFALHGWIMALMQTGCRVASARAGEEWLEDTSDQAMWSIRLTMEADRARRESEIRSERVKAGHARKDALGQGWVSLPLGYAYAGEMTASGTRVKFTGEVVTVQGEARRVRGIIAHVAEGGTLQTASRAYGRTPETIGAIVRQRCYGTGVLAWATGSLEVPALVPRDVQERAIAAIEARRTWDGTRNRGTGADTYAGRIECEHGHAWHTCYGPARKDGSRVRYYRTKPRCGCPMLRGDEVDELLPEFFAAEFATAPETVTRLRAGAMRDEAAIAKVRAAQVRMVQAGEIGSPAWAESVRALAQLEDVPEGPRWETVPTGRTLGEVFLALDMAGRRQWLANERLKPRGVRIMAGRRYGSTMLTAL